MNATKEKLVSIIMPTYNGSAFIQKAVESVLDQTFKNFELIIVNDGSTDDTEKIIKDLASNDSRIVLIKNEKNLGIQKTLNKGVAISRGEYIARIDDDDIWCDKEKLKNQINFFALNPDHVLVGTGVVVVDENNKEKKRYLMPVTDKDIRKTIIFRNRFIHSSVLFKTSAFQKVGGYNESQDVRNVEDYCLWLGLGRVGKFANLATYSVVYTERAGSLSGKNRLSQYKKMLNVSKMNKDFYSGYFWVKIVFLMRVIVLYLKSIF